MDSKGYRVAVLRLPAGGVERAPLLDFSSGYVTRAADRLPKQGREAPWRLHQNYVKDLLALGRGRLEDEAMDFR